MRVTFLPTAARPLFSIALLAVVLATGGTITSTGNYTAGNTAAHTK